MTKSNLKVSILTITYNHERFIRQTLESILSQETDFNYEVIVADDASTDRTQEIIKQITDKNPGIIKPVLRKKNIGALANSLDTLKRATGNYIALCEGDDYWSDSRKLQKQVDFLDKNAEYVGSFHRAKVIYEDGSRSSVYPDVKDSTWYTIEELLKINYIPTSSVLYRRQDYSKMPDNIMPLDWYIHLFHAKFGKIKYMPEVMSIYRKHDVGIWSDYDTDRDKIWLKYGLQFINLWTEVLKLYKNNKKLTPIIIDSTNDILSIFIDVDGKHKSRLFKDSVEAHPELLNDFIESEHKKLLHAKAEADSYKAQMLKLGDELSSIRYAHSATENELKRIKSTRTWRARSKVASIKNRKKNK